MRRVRGKAVPRGLLLGVSCVVGLWMSSTAWAETLPGSLLSATEVPLTSAIHALAPGRVERAESVDVTGDGVPDLIVRVALAPEEEDLEPSLAFRELWVASEGAVLRSTLVYRTPIAERWFANLDDDPEPEIVTASGFADGVDFAVVDQTDHLAGQNELFRFVPVVLTAGETPHAWAHPGNLDGARVARGSRAGRLVCSFAYPETLLLDAGVAGRPPYPQRRLPVLFFESPRVEGEVKLPIGDRTERSLEEITAESRAKVPDVTIRDQTLVAVLPARALAVSDQDGVEVASEFRWHLRGVHNPLTLAGISVVELRTAELIVRNGEEVDVFAPPGGYGYYFGAPGRAPRRLQGVYTDADLLSEAARYFCLPQWLPEGAGPPLGCVGDASDAAR